MSEVIPARGLAEGVAAAELENAIVNQSRRNCAIAPDLSARARMLPSSCSCGTIAGVNKATISNDSRDAPGRLWLVAGAVVCGLAVGLGAFGAHALEGMVATRYNADEAAARLESWRTAVQYQFWHGMALIAVGLWQRWSGQRTRVTSLVGGLFLSGVLVFSGCLYAWVLSDARPFVRLVPLGGLAFLAGWLLLALAFATSRADRDLQH
jgi:uncharacterized membrane protein YgdD (TMEM256/DUF423 family)